MANFKPCAGAAVDEASQCNCHGTKKRPQLPQMFTPTCNPCHDQTLHVICRIGSSCMKPSTFLRDGEEEGLSHSCHLKSISLPRALAPLYHVAMAPGRVPPRGFSDLPGTLFPGATSGRVIEPNSGSFTGQAQEVGRQLQEDLGLGPWIRVPHTWDVGPGSSRGLPPPFRQCLAFLVAVLLKRTNQGTLKTPPKGGSFALHLGLSEIVNVSSRCRGIYRCSFLRCNAEHCSCFSHTKNTFLPCKFSQTGQVLL